MLTRCRREPEDLRDRLLVVGAGPTGLAIAKAFGESGIPYLQVEATDHVGGNWAHGVYETAHIISSRRTTEYPDWPMPDSYPDFPSAVQMKAYYEAFADRFELGRSIRFGTELASASPEPGGGWLARFAGGEEVLVRGLVVANGHHWSRSLPDWANDPACPVLHSKDYRSPDQLRGRRVLVVGGGNSGCDVVSEAARVAASADWSLRRGYWILPKTLLGRPIVELLSPWLPIALQRLAIRALLRVVIGRYEDYGLPRPDHRIFEAHPTVSNEVFHYLRHGRIRVRPDVESAEGGAVRFRDGSTADYDLVVCATGYEVALPFLPEGTVEVIGKTPQLYGGLVTDRHRHLYVAGAYQVRYGIGPLLRPLALLLADWVRLQDELAVPLGLALREIGKRPPPSHLIEPHGAIREFRLARHLTGRLRRKGRRLERRLVEGRVDEPA